MLDSLGKKFQPLVGLATLGIVLLSAIALGANRPVSWVLLGFAVTGLFFLQVVIDMLRGISLPGRRLWLPGVLFLGVISWAYVQITPGLLPQFVHPVWALVEAPGMISADPGQAPHYMLRLSLYAMVFWIAVRSSEDRDDARRALVWIAIFTTAMAVFGLWVFFTGTNPLYAEDNTNVVNATFINRNNYATYAMMGIVINLALYVRLLERSQAEAGSRKRLRDTIEAFFAGGWIYGLGLLLGLGAVALSQSRAGGMATIIGIIAFLLFYHNKDSGGGKSVGPVILISVLGIVAYVGLTSSDGLLNRLLTTDGEDGRFLVYPKVIEGILDRPLVGHGLGAFHETFRAYVPLEAAFGEWDMAHNSWLENAWELGLPAAGALYLALLLVVWRFVRALFKRKNDRHFAAIGLAIALAAAFHAVFDFSLQIPAITALFAFVMGLAYAQSFGEQEILKARRKKNAE